MVFRKRLDTSKPLDSDNNIDKCLFRNKTKVISADLLDFDFGFEDTIIFGNISVLVTFQF